MIGVVCQIVIRGAIASFVCGKREGDQFIGAVAKAAHTAEAPADDGFGESGTRVTGCEATVPGVGDLADSVENIGEGAAELAAGFETGARRRLNVSVGETGEANDKGDEDALLHGNFRLFSK